MNRQQRSRVPYIELVTDGPDEHAVFNGAWLRAWLAAQPLAVRRGREARTLVRAALRDMSGRVTFRRYLAGRPGPAIAANIGGVGLDWLSPVEERLLREIEAWRSWRIMFAPR